MAPLEIPVYVQHRHVPLPEFLAHNRAKPLDPEWHSVFLATQNQVSDSEELLAILDAGKEPPGWATHVVVFSRSHP